MPDFVTVPVAALSITTVGAVANSFPASGTIVTIIALPDTTVTGLFVMDASAPVSPLVTRLIVNWSIVTVSTADAVDAFCVEVAFFLALML